MDFIRKNLITTLIFAACIVGLVMYQNYFAGASTDVLSTEVATSTPGSADILHSLSDLKAVTLDPSIFSDPVFVSLVDFGISIPPEPVGRPNPFAPLSGVRIAPSSANATTSASATR